MRMRPVSDFFRAACIFALALLVSAVFAQAAPTSSEEPALTPSVAAAEERELAARGFVDRTTEHSRVDNVLAEATSAASDGPQTHPEYFAWHPVLEKRVPFAIGHVPADLFDANAPSFISLRGGSAIRAFSQTALGPLLVQDLHDVTITAEPTSAPYAVIQQVAVYVNRVKYVGNRWATEAIGFDQAAGTLTIIELGGVIDTPEQHAALLRLIKGVFTRA